MQPQTIERRVERLEERVTRLEELPHRIDELTGQILQLRAENGSEFSALRSEMRTMDEGIVTQLRGEMRAMRDELKSHALVLHEDVIERLKIIGEGQSHRPKTPRRKR